METHSGLPSQSFCKRKTALKIMSTETKTKQAQVQPFPLTKRALKKQTYKQFQHHNSSLWEKWVVLRTFQRSLIAFSHLHMHY